MREWETQMQNLNPGFNQKISRFSVSFLLAATLAMLAGCSQNSSGTIPGTTGTTGTTGTSTATLTIALSTHSISASSTATVTATLKNASGAPVAGQVVTFSTDANFGSLSPTSALTGDGTGGTILGVATVTLSQASNALPGATYVTASAQGSTASAGYSVGGGGGGGGVTVGSVSVTATPASATANGFSLITIKATVLDAAAAPISNQPVTFTTAAGILSSSTAVTNASGVAQVFLTAPTTVGSANVVAYTGGVPASVLVSFVAGLPAAVAINMTPTSVAASGTTTIVATLKDFNGNAVGANYTVTFGTSSPLGSGRYFTDPSGVPGNVVSSVTTDALGEARILYVAGTCTGSCTDFLTANAISPPPVTIYATNLATLSVGGTAGTPTLTIGTITSPIAAGTPVTVTATLSDAAGSLVRNAVVTFSLADQTLATLSPANGTALTNNSGNATITLTASSLTSGATTITASAQVGTTPVSASSGFSVGAASVTLSNFVFGVGAGTLSAFGTTSMAVDVKLNGVLVTTPMTINFTSVCASSGKAVISSSATTVNGTATGSYRDNGCAGTDTVTATVSGIATLSANLAISAPAIGSLQFISASPTTISLKGIGGTETSQVTFKVVDASGNPLSGKTVSFGLSTTIGGITLTPASPSTAVSDNNGLAVITVNAGVVSTPVRVTATAGALTSQSNQLTITTGIPDQDSFSLSATTHSIEGWNYDGTTSVLTARLADHFNNPAPDGTAVNFTTEGGSVVGSCTTISGACSSTFTSQNPRPANGRVTVLAYAVGEETFTDLNGNGTVDSASEMIDANGVSTDIGDAYVDYNEDGVYESATEPFYDFSGAPSFVGVTSGVSPFNFVGATSSGAVPLQYHGVLCSTPGVGICSPQKSIYVRRSQVLTLSSSGANIALFTDAAQTTAATKIDLASCNSFTVGGGLADNIAQPVATYYLRVVDVNGNSMPAGTTLALTKTNGTILSPTSVVMPDTSACNSKFPGCPALAGSLALGVYPLAMQSDATYDAVAGTCTNPANTGVLTVTVTSFKGLITTRTFNVND